MGRFNTRGEYLTGVAGGPLMIDRRIIGQGSGRYVDDDRVIANAWDGVELNARLEPVFRLFGFSGGSRYLIDPRGASYLGAGGGNWAATLAAASGQVTFGMFRGQPLQGDYGRVLDVGRDGTMLFATGDNQRVWVVWPDGENELFHFNPGYFDDWRAIDGGFVFRSVENELRLMLRGAAASVKVRTFETPHEPYSFVVNRERWFLYHDDRILLHRDGDTVGHVFPPGYHPDICHVPGWPADMMRLGRASNEEGADGIVLTDFYVGLFTDPLDKPPVVVVPPPPVEPPPPPPPPIGVPVPSLDLRDCELINTNREILDFPITTRITKYWLADDGTGQYFEFTKQHEWPEFVDPGSGDTQCTLGVCLNIHGKWYASAGIQFWRLANNGANNRPGSSARDLFGTWFYAERWGPMRGYKPSPGEWIGFFIVQGNVRNGLLNCNVRERSGVVMLQFQPGMTYLFSEGGTTPVPPPTPTPVPVPVPVPPPAPTPQPAPGVTYDSFLRDAAVLRKAFKESHFSIPPDAAQEAHLHWRYLIEGYTLEQLLDQVSAPAP